MFKVRYNCFHSVYIKIKMKRFLLDKFFLLTILSLILLTVILNSFIFSIQLNYGFRDVDWQVLYYFKLFGKPSLNHLLQETKVLGVYIPESYYVGFLEKFLGINFVNLHQVTHLFKIIAAISVYVLVLKIFKRKLLAFVSSLIYTISYTHAGALFQLSSGGYFLAIISMNSFLLSYYYTLVRKITPKRLILMIFLLYLTFLLKSERMYPLIPLIILTEFFLLIINKFKRDFIDNSLKRLLPILLSFIIFYLFYHTLFMNGVPNGFSPNQFIIGTNIKIKSISNGNLQMLIEPLASLGSIFLHGDYLKILGQLNFQNFSHFVNSLLFGPVLRLGLVTLILFSLNGRKSFKLVFGIAAAVFIFGLMIYELNINWQHLVTSTRVHFDPNFVSLPSILGFYVLVLSYILFIIWLKNKDKTLIPPILGIAFSFLFILLTWISSDISLIFMGPQRYLSIPSIGASVFISGLLVITFNKLRNIKFTKQFSWIIFLLLIPLFVINYQVANKFFSDELTFAGARGNDQIRMKNKLHSLLGEMNTQDKSLFYFDESQDPDNAYFNEGTVLAGFEYWIKFNKDGALNNLPTPGMIRSTRQCSENTHLSCIKVLKDGLATENGDKGIWYADSIRGNIPIFYKLNDFLAYRFVNKDIIDIRKEVLGDLGL